MVQIMVEVRGLHKHFTLHNQGGVRLDVLHNVELRVARGQCLVLNGPSGTGKSTLLRALYANYLPQAGEILVRHGKAWIDMASAPSHLVLEVRRLTLGYVSQFLRVIPRVATLDIVSEPLRQRGVHADEARERAIVYLRQLRVPERLWYLAPNTFSGGEQQRVSIAHCFVADYPILLLDEPTASLDPTNRAIVVDLMRNAMAKGAALIGIFHDAEVRHAIATHRYDMDSGVQRSLAA